MKLRTLITSSFIATALTSFAMNASAEVKIPALETSKLDAKLAYTAALLFDGGVPSV